MAQLTFVTRKLAVAGIASALLGLAANLISPAPAPAASDNAAPKWKVWTYNSSGRAFKGSVPANAPPNGVATFSFPPTPDTALLLTDHGSYKGTLLGDLTGKTLNATVSDSGGPFTYYGQGLPSNPCPARQRCGSISRLSRRLHSPKPIIGGPIQFRGPSTARRILPPFRCP